MNETTLLNKSVVLYLDGGWQVSGSIKIFEKEKIILENEGLLSVVMRDKVSCMTILDNKKRRAAPPTEDVEPTPMPRSPNSDFPMNGISYEDSTLTIPMSLYGMKDDPDDFSITFSKNNESKISFGLDGEDDDS